MAGASWNFVIWGMLHGVYLAIYKMIQNRFSNFMNSVILKSKAGLIFSILATQYFVFLAWIAFRVKDTDFMLYSMKKYIFWDFATQNTIKLMSVSKLPIILIMMFFVLQFISYRKGNFAEKISTWNLKYWIFFLTAIMISILFLYDMNPQDFIYFRF